MSQNVERNAVAGQQDSVSTVAGAGQQGEDSWTGQLGQTSRGRYTRRDQGEIGKIAVSLVGSNQHQISAGNCTMYILRLHCEKNCILYSETYIP
jgi:hypothetical protein